MVVSFNMETDKEDIASLRISITQQFHFLDVNEYANVALAYCIIVKFEEIQSNSNLD